MRRILPFLAVLLLLTLNTSAQGARLAPLRLQLQWVTQAEFAGY